MKKICLVDGCDSSTLAQGLCPKHYQRMRSTGSPTGTLRKSAASRFWSKVIQTDSCWLWTASKTSDGYGQLRIDGKNALAHRFSYELLVGPIPRGLVIDHICHVTACVNPRHLRPVTHKQNLENLTGANANSRSGVRGVYWCEDKVKWRAQIIHEYQRIHVGYFDSLDLAEAAVVAKRNELFTHNDIDRAA